MEQLGFLPVSIKPTQWLALRLVKYTGASIPGLFEFAHSSSNKIFLEKVDFL